jgi:hypothetical protein
MYYIEDNEKCTEVTFFANVLCGSGILLQYRTLLTIYTLAPPTQMLFQMGGRVVFYYRKTYALICN